MRSIETKAEIGDTNEAERGLTLRDKLNDDQRALLDEALSGGSDAVHQVAVGNDEAVFTLWRSGLIERGLDATVLDREIAAMRLRGQIVERTAQEVAARQKNGPPPDADELALGAFREAVEPQVRDAVMALRNKGYGTISSGFAEGAHQAIVFTEDVSMIIPPEVLSALAAEGVEVKGNRMDFVTPEIDEQAIKERWDKAAALIPGRGAPAAPSETGMAASFRERYEK